MRCLLEAALLLLRTGRVGMGILLVERALEQQTEQQKTKRVALPARTRKARARP